MGVDAWLERGLNGVSLGGLIVSDAATLAQDWSHQGVASGRFVEDYALAVVSPLIKICGRGLVRGPVALAALTQSAFADEVGLDDSQVSRVLGATTFHLDDERFSSSFLISPAVSAAVALSQTQASLLLLRVAELDPQGSDQALSESMAALGVPIARRTVAKYRGQFNIADRRVRSRWGDSGALREHRVEVLAKLCATSIVVGDVADMLQQWTAEELVGQMRLPRPTDGQGAREFQRVRVGLALLVELRKMNLLPDELNRRLSRMGTRYKENVAMHLVDAVNAALEDLPEP